MGFNPKLLKIGDQFDALDELGNLSLEELKAALAFVRSRKNVGGME